MVENGQHQRGDFQVEAPKAPHNPGEPSAKTGVLREVVNFVRVSPVQQLLAAVNFAIASRNGIVVAERFSQGNYDTAERSVAITLLSLAFLGASEYSALSNFSEYKKIKKALARHRWDSRIVEPKSHSWCDRHAARVAAIDSGHKSEIDEYYAEKGYKWYHIFPDFKR